MITFILNNQLISTDQSAGSILLDYIRYEKHLMGSKVGCREGDCGACTVLEGSLVGGELHYKSVVSCLCPLGNVQGKHIVTIEGLQKGQLSPVQHKMIQHAATQCGFCTPGFVMSLTAHSLDTKPSDKEKAVAAIGGNICRCTGYKSIERAAEDLSAILEKKESKDPLGWLIEQAFLPEYFREIPGRLKEIESQNPNGVEGLIVGGGTDLFVQKADLLQKADLQFLHHKKAFKDIEFIGEKCFVGASVTATQIMDNETLQTAFPNLKEYFKLISSEPIRNMGTLAGNIMNASPIADLVIIFLALDANLHLKGKNGSSRNIPLRKFYSGYKQTQLAGGEQIEKIEFMLPRNDASFNFEKVSKRQHLDIASVNSAIQINIKENRIAKVHLSAGGVFAFPFYAENTVKYLEGKTLNHETLLQAALVLEEEIVPISDIRGSREYKSLLLRQLFFAHFITLFPKSFTVELLLEKIVSE